MIHPAGIASVVQVHAVIANVLAPGCPVADPLGLVRVGEESSLAGEGQMVDDLTRVNESDDSLEERSREEICLRNASRVSS